MTDGECQVARVTISSDQGTIFRLPPRDCQIGSAPAQINAAAGHLVRIISGRKYGWDFPSFADNGRDLWVTSQTGGFAGKGTVTELSTRTGRLVHFFSARKYHFDYPFALAIRGRYAWILNLYTVTRLQGRPLPAGLHP